MIIEIQNIFRMKHSYFFHFWSYIDIGIIGCSWGVLGVYIWRYYESNRIGNLFKQTNGYVYINLQLSAYVNNVFTYLLGFCCFFGSVKLLRLCRFNRRIVMFTETLRNARKDLISFIIMFSSIFIAFLTLFYLLFISQILSCSTVLKTAEMLFQMMSMKYPVNQLQEADAFLGPFCFTLYIFIVVFICMSMFITIIRDNFRIIRKNFNFNLNEDYEVLRFMFRKFKRCIGKIDL
jgi:polycystin 1L2